MLCTRRRHIYQFALQSGHPIQTNPTERNESSFLLYILHFEWGINNKNPTLEQNRYELTISRLTLQQ